MLTAIDLDDEPGGRTEEIDHTWTQRRLLAKPSAAELLSP